VAATLAGVLAFEDALRLVAARGRMMQEQPSGAMLSVRLPAAEVEPRLHGQLAIASDNGPELCVVAGPHAEVDALAAEFAQAGVAARPLQTSHAFHSAMMDPVVGPFRALVQGVRLSEPKLPFVSTATGDWIKPEEATSPDYWARHLRLRVRFAEGVRALWAEPSRILLEVGPRSTLATLARQQVRDRSVQLAVASLGDSDETSWNSLLLAAGQLWVNGVELAPDALHGEGPRQRIPLPSYPFERKRFWIDRAGAPAAVTVSAAATDAPPALAASPVVGQAPDGPGEFGHTAPPPSVNGIMPAPDGLADDVIAQQLWLMNQQLVLLQAALAEGETEASGVGTVPGVVDG
jgi:acyl transferase domain-containing protein